MPDERIFYLAVSNSLKKDSCLDNVPILDPNNKGQMAKR